MKRALLLLSLPLLAASCGSVSSVPAAPESAVPGPSMPAPTAPVTGSPGPAPLVSLRLSAAGDFKAQGLAGALPAAHFDVRVRDSNNKPVTFNGGTYDASGKGSTVLTLNAANTFQQTLLLPAGDYTFENAVLDDATGKVLLAYGPAKDNTGAVRDAGSVVQLKFHAVFDKASSALAPAVSVPALFTGRTFMLALNPRTAAVAGQSASVPTADLGNVIYTLGNPTDGVLNNAGGKVGVNVTAGGTASDAVLNVTASFGAWIRNAGTDTATYGTATLEYAQDIELGGLVADLGFPEVTFAPVAGAVRNAVTPLSGTATDKVKVAAVRVYDNGALLASSDRGDSAAALTLIAGGDWAADWTPASAGSHTLTVVVTDTSGNEARAEQTTEVGEAPAQASGEFIFSLDTRSAEFDLLNGIPRTFRVVVPSETSAPYLALFDPGDCVQTTSFCVAVGVKRFFTAMVDGRGQSVPIKEYAYQEEDGSPVTYDETLEGLSAGEYWVTVTPTADTRVSLYGYLN